MRFLRYINTIVPQNQSGLLDYIKLVMMQISAKTKKTTEKRISQCDIFHDIDVIEQISERDEGIAVSYIHFPLVICLNQDCDLNSDERDKLKVGSNKDCRLLHLIIAPLFNFDILRTGSIGEIFFKQGRNIILTKPMERRL